VVWIAMIVPDTRPASEFQLTWSPILNVFAMTGLPFLQHGQGKSGRSLSWLVKGSWIVRMVRSNLLPA